MTPIEAMALYDSRHRPQRVTIAKTKAVDILTHSSYWLDKNTIIIEVSTGHYFMFYHTLSKINSS